MSLLQAYSRKLYQSLFVERSPEALRANSEKQWGELSMLHQTMQGLAHGSLASCQITLVTALFDLGRSNVEGLNPREVRSFDSYVKWFTQVLGLNTCLVIHVEPHMVGFVRGVRHSALGRQRADLTTHIIPNTLEELDQHKHGPANRRILANATYIASVHRPGRPEMVMPLYNVLMYCKVDWLAEAVKLNPFGSDAFFWMDGGYTHGKLSHLKGKVWPSPAKVLRRLHRDKIFMTQMRAFRRADCEPTNLDSLAIRHYSVLTGNFFGGSAQAIERYAVAFDDALADQHNNGVVDDDQHVMFRVLCRNMDMVDLNVCRRSPVCMAIGLQPCWDSGLCPVRMFAND